MLGEIAQTSKMCRRRPNKKRTQAQRSNLPFHFSIRPLMHILLVEDNPGDVRLAEEAFKECRLPVRLTVVNDGDQAIKYLTNQAPYEWVDKPDLVLLDLNLPKLNGREVLERIKSNKALRHLPVMILTTSTAQQDIEATYDLHVNCYIKKPLEFDDFAETVKNIERFWFETAILPSQVVG
jgi:two-component system, chemotaxis family, response regulator Rcp1